MVIIKASIRPLIQLNATAELDVTTTATRSLELPDDQTEWVRIMLTPDPEALLLRKEKINSPTWLLAATYTFKILTVFKLKLKLITFGIVHHMNAGHFQVCLTVRKIRLRSTYSSLMANLICKLNRSC